MENNIIFYFTGTGNSFKVAKDIAGTIGNCELYNMGSKIPELSERYNNIGFVYPTYFGGMPKVVKKFVEALNFKHSTDAYVFAIATYGGFVANGLRETGDVLRKKNIKLSYGSTLKMMDNYIVWYDTGKKIEEKTKESNEHLIPIINDIKEKKTIKLKKAVKIVKLYSDMQRKTIHKKAEDFQVAPSCIECKKCEELCPVNNIKMKDSKPTFGSKCEQCMGCIQFCPTKAINYKEKTNGRGRYVNPEITLKELIIHNKK